MVRLIDADKLSKNTCKGICSNCNDMYAGENVKTNCSEVRLYFLKKIQKAPTVDAIPVDWLLDHQIVGDDAQNKAVQDLVNYWRLENGQTDKRRSA